MKAIHSTRVMFGFTAEVTRALAHPARVELLDLLAQGERSVDSIAKAACLSGRQCLAASEATQAGRHSVGAP